MALTEKATNKPVAKPIPKEEAGRIEQRARSLVTVFSDGTTILLEGFKPCPGPKCKGAVRPMADFGYRRMASGVIRPQSRCKRDR